MDFDFSEQALALQRLVRRFVEDELMPLEKEVGDRWELTDDQERELDGRATAIGLKSIDVPAEYGGAGFTTVENCLVKEELGKTTTPYGFPGSVSNILYACNDEQKERFLFPCIRGEKRAFFAQTEPNGGSDPASMETSAVRDGDDWILNGRKIFITAAHKSDFGQVLTVSDKEKRSHGGITCFLVEQGTPGFEVVRRIPVMGREWPCELAFIDCRVPSRNILGEPGQGFILGQKWLSANDRLGQGPTAVGLSERCLKLATAYSKQRVTFGRPIAERQAIQWMLADSAVEIHACRMMTYYGAWKADQGGDIRIEASMVRLYATEMQQRIVDRCLQIHGAIGLTDDLPLARMYRHVRSFRITGGSSEIQRFIIARWVLRD